MSKPFRCRHSAIAFPNIGNSLIETVYDEARRSTRYGAYTAAVMLCRKLLMHIAVEKGAQENLRFATYVNFLQEKGYVPPGGKEWVDRIRDKANEANHEIVLMSAEDARTTIRFTEMLLRFVYEMPNLLRGKK